MTNMLKKWLLACAACLLFFSCEKTADYVEKNPLEDVSSQVRSDFLSRAGEGVQVSNVVRYPDGEDCSIWYVDQDGARHKSLYFRDVWQYDLEFIPMDRLYDLPEAVRNAGFIRPDIIIRERWRDSLFKIKRRGIKEPYYEFQFELLYAYNAWYIGYELIRLDGEPLTVLDMSHNDSTYWYDLDELMAFIEESYPGSEILAFCVPGESCFYIRHEGIVKRVYFHNHSPRGKQQGEPFWSETIFPLPDDWDVPEDVDECARDLDYTAVFYRETPQGVSYGFQVNNTISYFQHKE